MTLKKLIYPLGCDHIEVGLPNEDLLIRLEQIKHALSNERSNTYEGLVHYLAFDFFLKHDLKEVQILVACIISDIFRLQAPLSPFANPVLLQNVLFFLADQIHGLKGEVNKNIRVCIYEMLNSLNSSGAFHFFNGLEHAKDLFSKRVEMMFDLVSYKSDLKLTGQLYGIMIRVQKTSLKKFPSA